MLRYGYLLAQSSKEYEQSIDILAFVNKKFILTIIIIIMEKILSHLVLEKII